jgi:hypothetical protein
MNLVNRYKDYKTKKYKNRELYRTILYPLIPPRISDLYIIPNENDRLDLLAHKYYGDVRYWWIIAQANHLGKGSLRVKPGIRLRIPIDKNSILQDFEKINEKK